MIFLINVEKIFDKIQHPFLSKLGIERNFLQAIKDISTNPTATIMLNDQVGSLATFIKDYNGDAAQYPKIRKGNKNNPDGKETLKLPYFQMTR